MPVDWSKYPPDWEQVRERVRLRSHDCCEFCGLPNGAWAERVAGSPRYRVVDEVAARDGRRVIRIVLTVAHLDHNPANNGDDNLRHLCQPCHLRWDVKHHMRNAAETRRRKKREAGQLELM